MLWNNEKRRTIAFTLTPKATPVFTFAKALLKVAFAKVLLALGACEPHVRLHKHLLKELEK